MNFDDKQKEFQKTFQAYPKMNYLFAETNGFEILVSETITPRKITHQSQQDSCTTAELYNKIHN